MDLRKKDLKMEGKKKFFLPPPLLLAASSISVRVRMKFLMFIKAIVKILERSFEKEIIFKKLNFLMKKKDIMERRTTRREVVNGSNVI